MSRAQLPGIISATTVHISKPTPTYTSITAKSQHLGTFHGNYSVYAYMLAKSSSMSSKKPISSRPSPSVLQSLIAPASPRAISFAASPSSPLTRPTTSSSRDISEFPKGELSRRRSEGSATTPMVWTDTQQDRLLVVQAELKKAQKRWSASQEQWLEEVSDDLSNTKTHA